MKTIIIKGDKYIGKTLAMALSEEGIETAGVCGGTGTCGKCQVTVNGESALACRYPVEEDLQVALCEAPEAMRTKASPVELPQGFAGDEGEADTYGIALDLGTTTIAVMAWGLADGKPVDVETLSNPQSIYGADIMSRMDFASRSPENAEKLRSSLIKGLNQAISAILFRQGIAPEQLRRVAAVGNTAMSHLFLGKDINGLATYPFTPVFTGGVTLPAGRVGLAVHEEAEVYIGPCIAGHVGADVTVGLLAAGYMDGARKKQGNLLYYDIGTNGEMVLLTAERALCCSTAAGPAFEGGSICQGMRAVPGAIYKVDVVNGSVQPKTIGEKPAVGICGSGLIDAMAAMVKTHRVDAFGRIDGEEELNDFVLVEGSDVQPRISVTQQDVREIQMAKAAIGAGSRILLEKAGLTEKDLDEITVAGVFGSRMDLDSARTIGLLPHIDRSKMISSGNCAGIGASMVLLSKKCREQAEQIAATVEHIELAASTAFQSKYIEEMNFWEEA